MQNVLYAHIDDVKELLEKIDLIEKMVIDPQQNVKLIIIDSFSFLLRTSAEDQLDRINVMGTILTRLLELIQTQNIALVITNDLTTKIYDDNESKLWPSLGNHFGQRMNQRILLSRNREEGFFEFFPFKTFFNEPEHVKFVVEKGGINEYHNL